MMTSRLCIGVLTDHNPNVYYELGIAHSTQQIDRQILLVPKDKDYLSKFDLQHLTYSKYNSENPLKSSEGLAKKIQEKLSYYNYQKDRKLEQIISQISFDERMLLFKFGGYSHFLIFPDYSDETEKMHIFQSQRD